MLPLHTQLGIGFVLVVGALFLYLVGSFFPRQLEKILDDGSVPEFEEHPVLRDPVRRSRLLP